MCIRRVQLQETEPTLALFSREALAREQQVSAWLERLEGPTAGLPPPLPTVKVGNREAGTGGTDREDVLP